ncbi:hypothetical protein [Woodsholea maritima]|uniref:hypothetical protein n=1 Tax=Woodsholea maritima TaxID=240237 RepID=UPI000375020E|nr:hypothetical protein [Woodsholea maritima]
MSEETAQRCDIWLFRARLFKSRALAAKFIDDGKVRLTRHGQTRRLTKAASTVMIGDHLTFQRESVLFSLDIVGLGTRRGPASEAMALYTRKDIPLSDD